MKVVAQTLVVLLSVLSLVVSSSSSPVEEVTDDSLRQLIESHPAVLALFYAPWDDQTSSFLPSYDLVSSDLSDKSVKVVKIDASANEKAAQRFRLAELPTIRLILDHDTAVNYAGPRDRKSLVDFVNRAMGPAVSILRTRERVEEFVKENPTSVLACFGDSLTEGTALREAYEKEADQQRFVLSAGFATVEGPADLLGVSACPSLVVNAPGLPKREIPLDPTTNSSSLSRLFNVHTLPPLGEIGPATFSRYFESGLPMAWLVMPNSNVSDHSGVMEEVAEVAKEFRGRLVFMWLDDSKYHPQTRLLAVPDGRELPWFVVTRQSHVGAQMRKYVLPESKGPKVTGKAARELVTEFLEGKLQEAVRSQQEPSEEDQGTRSVKMLVATNFERLVMDPTKDVVVKMYASWCGHCQALAPIYEEVAKALRSVESLVVAEVEATENDLPTGIVIEGYPTIMLFPANNKTSPVEHNGERSVAGLWEFIQKSVSIPITEVPKEMKELLERPPVVEKESEPEDEGEGTEAPPVEQGGEHVEL